MLTQIGEWFKTIFAFVGRRDIYTILIIVFVSAASFGLGKLSQDPIEKAPVRIENAFPSVEIVKTNEVSASVIESVDQGAVSGAVQGSFVGSKNSDKYHYPWCSGAQRIKEENKVWFASREEATEAGYIPAKNCKGL